MLSKTSQGFFKQAVASSKVACIAQAPARNFAGGGPKKPNMPATETNFDVVFVGNSNRDLKSFRWCQCNCPR